jgi:hypothetical protein
MLNSLLYIKLNNFKCFQNHSVYFNDCTVMIGQNNAGKTTVVEALRLLGLACARLKTIKAYPNRPEWLKDNLGQGIRGVKISAKAIDTDLEQVFYQYGDPPAIIEAAFSNNIAICIYINAETDLYATLWKDGKNVASNIRANEIGVPNVRVLPQIIPLLKEEPYVSVETLQKNQFSKRTSGNFRNNLLKSKGTTLFDSFQKMIDETWGAIKISRIETSSDLHMVSLDIRDKSYVTEIYYMGHGIQMWLQTLWFITCSSPDAIIVLDEPDVYIHADLQRKLVRMLNGNYAQIIIATHSVEIISEVRPENILIINRNNEESILADGYPILQTAISNLGSIHNITLARMLNNKKYIYVEGDDLELLRVFYDKIYPQNSMPLDHIPNVSTGGWGSWDIQKDNARRLIEITPTLKTYFIYDRDYHLNEDVSVRELEANNRNIRLHVWKSKELENYVISSEAIAAFICQKNCTKEYNAVNNEVLELIIELSNERRIFIRNQRFEELSKKKEYKGKAVRAIELADEWIEQKWKDYNSIISIVPGKEMISKLSELCKKKYNVSFSPIQIASAMKISQIPEEVKEVLQLIYDGA